MDFDPSACVDLHIHSSASDGTFSPTEIQAAHEAGADFVKIFPASLFGPAYIRAIKAPLPHLRLMPTGGITAGNVLEWLDAGADLLGVGSALLDKPAIAAGDFDKITDMANQFSCCLDKVR